MDGLILLPSNAFLLFFLLFRFQRMPPKLVPLAPRPPPASTKPKEDSMELVVGNIRVGPDGVEFTGGEDLHVQHPDLNLKTLVKVKPIGQGVQGNVSMYRHTDGKEYAVKSITFSLCDDRMRQTVAAELRNIFSQSNNEYMINLYNAFFLDGQLMLVMEYMDWGNLQEFLEAQRASSPDSKLSESVGAFIAGQLLRALNILHKKANIVTEAKQKTLRQIHRDIKPDNILLSVDGKVKLTDFGIATSTETIGVSSFVGTPTYMSPERIQGERYSIPSDIWSVGVVIAQLLLGRYPFPSVSKGFMALLFEVTSTDRISLRGEAQCSEEAEDFVNCCLRKVPDERSTAEELLKHAWITKNEEAGRGEIVELLRNTANCGR